LPRRGIASKPRVAASATLGSEVEVFFNRNAVVSGTSGGRNRDAVERLRILSFPRVAEAATLGFEM